MNYWFSLSNSGESNWGHGNAAQDTFLSRLADLKLTLSGNSDSNLTVTSNTTGLVVAGKTYSNSQILIGLTFNYSSIQSIEQETVFSVIIKSI